jgi:hypothetical protein
MKTLLGMLVVGLLALPGMAHATEIKPARGKIAPNGPMDARNHFHRAQHEGTSARKTPGREKTARLSPRR